MKLNTQQVGRAGESFVVAEIYRRGGYATAFAGNMPTTDIVASSVDQSRVIHIQVKTKTTGDWQTSTARALDTTEPDETSRFWILVDLAPEHRAYAIVPEWWIQKWLYDATREAVARRERAGSTSTHARIPPKAVEQWRGRWDLLGIFDAATEAER